MQNNPVNTDQPLFCPREDCVYYQSYDNKITKDGIYKTKSDAVPRLMFFCHGGVIVTQKPGILSFSESTAALKSTNRPRN